MIRVGLDSRYQWTLLTRYTPHNMHQLCNFTERFDHKSIPNPNIYPHSYDKYCIPTICQLPLFNLSFLFEHSHRSEMLALLHGLIGRRVLQGSFRWVGADRTAASPELRRVQPAAFDGIRHQRRQGDGLQKAPPERWAPQQFHTKTLHQSHLHQERRWPKRLNTSALQPEIVFNSGFQSQPLNSHWAVHTKIYRR